MNKVQILIVFMMLLFIAGVHAIRAQEESGPPTQQLDINRASLEELETLPIDSNQAQTLWEYREYTSYFESIYEIRRLPGFDQGTFDRIKPLIKVMPVRETDEEVVRMNEIYYRIEQWAANEGTNEGLVDLWIDQAKDPINVNTASLTDLMNLQNVSPVDAVAIIKQRERIGGLNSRSDLGRVPGISDWGYRNARNFLRYTHPGKELDFHGDYQFRIYNTPLFSDFDDILNEGAERWWDLLEMDEAKPTAMHKIRLRWGQTIRAGVLAYRGLGEDMPLTDVKIGGQKLFTTRTFPTVKRYAGIENVRLGPVNVERLYVGNYMVTIGQGLVMENTDFFKPRKSGFSWDKRLDGVIGDITRTEEFALDGIAAQVSCWKLRALMFYSKDQKDAVLNPDSTANSYIIMTPRVDNELLEENGYLPMKDVLEEKTWGGNLRYSPWLGTHIGFSFYESIYDRPFIPKFSTISTRGDKLTTADSEYLSAFESPHGVENGQEWYDDYRRVYGVDFQTIYKNVSFQGEFASLDKGPSFDRQVELDGNPTAVVLSAYTQYNNLNILGIYRNYDVGFDNPYCRAFSNYQRYKRTIFEDEFYLTNPLYGQIYDNAVQPQAEEGFYISSRYRVSQALTPQLEFDIWKRKADDAQHMRTVAKIDYQPIYPLRLQLRQTYLYRDEDNELTAGSFKNIDTRLRLRMRLSGYDELEALYNVGYTLWPPRPRLVDDVEPDGQHPSTGNLTSNNEALGMSMTHNFNDYLKLRGFFGIYDGFFWNFEDSEFTVLDGHAYRYWFSVSDRVSNRLAVRFKYTVEYEFPSTYIDARYFNEPSGADPEGSNVRNSNHSYRLQVDYNW
jgi:DNA uptake protein ComE-like DNA-binding protein